MHCRLGVRFRRALAQRPAASLGIGLADCQVTSCAGVFHTAIMWYQEAGEMGSEAAALDDVEAEVPVNAWREMRQDHLSIISLRKGCSE